MAINPALLIAAPVLQNYIVDKTLGTPLAGGIITLYHDNSRSFLKNWYYQSGAPGNYTYIPLDNPLILSSVGTIQDPNGNDVIPFFYPYSEDDENEPDTYYITVYSTNEDGQQSTLQFTRENFPFIEISNAVENPTFENYVINNGYWRNIGSLNATNVTNQIICPSQHEGYSFNSDIRFIKDVTGANDSLSFNQMTKTLVNDITPEFYINFQCTNSISNQMVKCIQYPVSLHLDTLQNVPFSLVIHAQNVGGSPNNYLDLYVYQFTGTGALSPSNTILIRRIFLDNNFQKFVIPFTFPSIQGLSLGLGGDDALFIRVQYPLNSTFNINHTKVQVYLSDTVPTNEFQTYDEVNSIISSPRTGDFKSTLNDYNFGYVPANDGSIGNSSSNASTRANSDTWPLYNFIWNKVLNNWAPVSGGRGTTAISDFNANKTLTLTRSLGRVISGQNVSITPVQFTTNFPTVPSGLILSVNVAGMGWNTGSPVQLTNTGGSLPSGLSANTVYYLIFINNTTVSLATTLDNAYNGVPINIGSNQTGTSIIQSALGAYFGESLHILTIPEMPSHLHTTPQNFSATNAQAGSGVNAAQPGSENTSSVGGGLGHNNIPPEVILNGFFKL